MSDAEIVRIEDQKLCIGRVAEAHLQRLGRDGVAPLAREAALEGGQRECANRDHYSHDRSNWTPHSLRGEIEL